MPLHLSADPIAFTFTSRIRMRSSPALPRTTVASAVALAALLAATTAEAAPRIAVLGPSGAPVVPRLERNVAALKLELRQATVTLCTRDVVSRLVEDLAADGALCTDGEQVTVWKKEGGRLALKESVVVHADDDRGQELAAARAVMALGPQPADEQPTAKSAPGSFTIVASGAEASLGSSTPAATGESTSPVKDTPSPVPTPPPAERNAPRVILAIGPGVAASRDGSSFAVTAAAELGVSRYVALVPWIQFVPANRTVERPLGSASFRPTIFGFGFNVPILPHSSIVVPRLGCGYGILWMHVAPDSATSPATARAPEDLLAPIMYATGALSVRVAQNLRVAGEGMFGVSSHDMVVRIAHDDAAHWGVPIASLTLRGEWVFQ